VVDQTVLGENGVPYRYRNITLDKRVCWEVLGKNSVYRIMKAAGLRSQRGY